MCIIIISFPVDDVINFEINRSFLSSRFPAWPKMSGKNLNLNLNRLRTKRIFKVEYKAFFSFSKGFQLPEIVSDLGVPL